MTRVMLSSEEEMPKIPPISFGATALVAALLITVLSTPPETAIGKKNDEQGKHTGRKGPSEQRNSHHCGRYEDEGVLLEAFRQAADKYALGQYREHANIGQNVSGFFNF